MMRISTTFITLLFLGLSLASSSTPFPSAHAQNEVEKGNKPELPFQGNSDGVNNIVKYDDPETETGPFEVQAFHGLSMNTLIQAAVLRNLVNTGVVTGGINAQNLALLLLIRNLG